MFQAVKQLGSKAAMLAGVLAVATAAAPALATEKPMAVQIFNAGRAPAAPSKLFDAGRKQVTCGVQFTGTIPAQTTYLYYTFDWAPAEYVEWSVMSDSVYSGEAEFTLSPVSTQRSTASDVTYWLTITNNTSSSQNFEGRYCIL